MKEKLNNALHTAKGFWQKRSKSQKGLLIGGLAAIVILIAVLSLAAGKTNFTPLYNNLSAQEVAQIKSELDNRKIPYEIGDNGKAISVPEEQVDSLLVDLAGEGLPDSGSIDYSFFSKNSSWGITDNEFDMMKLDATQTELSNLIKGIDGIEDAKVMINMPKDPVFVSEDVQQASASIVLHTKPGYKLENNQVNTLYTLVSKAVPNLPAENIAIMNQYFEYYDQQNQSDEGDSYTSQQHIKKDVEHDIQRRLQQMLGTMVGLDNVIVSVTADIDFTKENSVSEIVEPVDKENMEGLPVSVEKIHETYANKPKDAGGTAGTGDEDIASYQASDDEQNGDYEIVKEKVNNEFNKIHKEIVQSPYKIRDLGIQVAVNRIKDQSGEQVEYLSQQEQNNVQDGITSILDSIITTSVDKGYGDVDPNENASIIFQDFNGSMTSESDPKSATPIWMYVVGGILVVLIIVLLILMLRKRKASEEDDVSEELTEKETEMPADIPDLEADTESDSVKRRKQLEKMAKEQPEDFAKLLRSWISED